LASTIADFSRDAYILMVRNDAPVKSVADVRIPGGPPIVLGGTAEGATGSDIPLVLRDALGINSAAVSWRMSSELSFTIIGSHITR
jgi:hypothetical protein